MMEIERSWGREPGWFMTLPPDTQGRLIGWWNVYCNPDGDGR